MHAIIKRNSLVPCLIFWRFKLQLMISFFSFDLCWTLWNGGFDSITWIHKWQQQIHLSVWSFWELITLRMMTKMPPSLLEKNETEPVVRMTPFFQNIPFVQIPSSYLSMWPLCVAYFGRNIFSSFFVFGIMAFSFKE